MQRPFFPLSLLPLSLLTQRHSSCKEHSAMFLLAELCRLSLRAWKIRVLPLVRAANAHISYIFCLLSVNSSASSYHPGSQALQDRVGQISPLAYITFTSFPNCLDNSLPPPSKSLSLWWLLACSQSEPAECRCEGVYVSLMRQSWWYESVWANREETGVWQAVSHRVVSVWGHADVSAS